MIAVDLNEKLNQLACQLSAIEARELTKRHPTLKPEVWRWQEGKRWIKLDCGHQCHFLIENPTGEIFNIKAYGVPDHNKKAKADLGNVMDSTAEELWLKRYNALR